jgi:hypothetical protein
MKANNPGDNAMKNFHLLTAVAGACLLASCGGGGDNTTSGTLLEAPQSVTTVSSANLDAGTAASGLQAISGKAKCDVRVLSLNYATKGANGEATNASGVMLVPAGACAGTATRWWPMPRAPTCKSPAPWPIRPTLKPPC